MNSFINLNYSIEEKEKKRVSKLFLKPQLLQTFLHPLMLNSLIISYFCDPAGIRTQDPYIKSVMLYRLSYGIGLILSFGALCRGKISVKNISLHPHLNQVFQKEVQI